VHLGHTENETISNNNNNNNNNNTGVTKFILTFIYFVHRLIATKNRVIFSASVLPLVILRVFSKVTCHCIGFVVAFYHPYILPCLFLFMSYHKNDLFEFIQSLNHCYLTWMQLERVLCMFSGCIGNSNLKHFQISLNISLLLTGAARKISFEFTLNFV
jgi:hypothetical protein